MIWATTRYSIDLSQPRVMGIVNVTPDSFSDGGVFAQSDAAMAHCDALVAEGADILDIGGESTRPNARVVPVEEELSRVLPVLRHALTLGVPVSVDTYKPAVMRAALELGADIINDVWALRWQGDDGLSGRDVVVQHGRCGVCLMHMHREPATMQAAPMEGDVVAQVLSFLELHTQQLRDMGVESSRMAVDCGIGFGKTVEQNFRLLANQSALLSLGCAVLAGWSRKSSLGAVTQTSLAQAATLDRQDRMVPSIAAALLSVERGARVVRVHDVKETVQALKVWRAMQAAHHPLS